jgi:hypothetical protein
VFEESFIGRDFELRNNLSENGFRKAR